MSRKQRREQRLLNNPVLAAKWERERLVAKGEKEKMELHFQQVAREEYEMRKKAEAEAAEVRHCPTRFSASPPYPPLHMFVALRPQARVNADFDKRQAEEQHERLEHELRRDPLPLSEDASRSCSSKMHACAARAGLAGSRATAAATASMCAARGVRLSAGRRRAAICVGADHPLSVWCASKSSSMTARVARGSAAAGQASSGVEALVEA